MIDEKIAHLNMLQNIISRMANNSFLVKGWSITLVAAVAALSARDSDLNFLYIAFFPVVLFWPIDAYYLSLERCYRELYDSVANDTFSGGKFSLRVKNNEGCLSFLKSFFSLAIAPFYLVIVIMIVWFAQTRGQI